MPRLFQIAILAILASFIPGRADGQSTAPAPLRDISLADQATDDAAQRLFDTIAGLLVVSDDAKQSVAAVLSPFPLAERRFRQTLLDRARVGPPRQPSPGVTAVDVSVSTEQLADALQAALKDETSEAHSHIRLDPAAGHVIAATGHAARSGIAGDERRGWRHCRPGDMTITRDAAKRDLHQRLLTWLLRVPLANRKTVGQLARENPRIAQAMRRQLDRIIGDDYAFEPTGICTLTLTVSAEQLTTLLRAALADGGLRMEGDLRPAVAFENEMTVQGFAVAPHRPLPNPVRMSDASRPSWVTQTLSKTASASAPEMNDDKLRQSLAIQAAQVEAQRQLWIDLEKLAMPDGQTLGQHLLRRADRVQVAAAIDEAVLTQSSPTVDEHGTARVTLGVHLEAVWQILGQ